MTFMAQPAAVATSRTGETARVGLRGRHAWRTVLESRWGERLIAVITLSMAYQDAADRSAGAVGSHDGGTEQVRRLMRKAVAARRALADTEDALARLSEGSFGYCEQCAGPIPADRLAQAPETRYCRHCA
jgi:RNA polymerase-binding transcription factor DksA